jgi:hypothetical protein
VNDQEHQVQKAICHYLDLRKVCYFAVPNGGPRNLITAKKLKAEGVKAGVPDICIISDGMAFFLEVKRPKTVLGDKGRLSAAQKDMIEKIEYAGGEVRVVYSVADVIEACIDWSLVKKHR